MEKLELHSPPSPGAPTDLRVNDVFNPFGAPAFIYFSYKLTHSEKNQIQARYQILVASSRETLDAGVGDVWDSGEVTSRTQSHIAYQGAALSSNRRYFWNVRWWDEAGRASAYSATATFDVGLLTNEDWAGAKWIRRESEDADDYTYYRKRFSLNDGQVTRAMLYISAVHKYELYLNGGKVGTGPAYHYPQYQYYNAYDVTERLSAGEENVLAVFVHWFGAGQGRPESARGLIAKLFLEYSDGTSEILATDATWRQARAEAWVLGQPQRNHEGVGYVERIDAARLLPNWFAADLDDSGWQNAIEVGAHPVEPWVGTLRADLTRIVEREIKPVSSARVGDAYVADLGKVWAGRPKIHFEGGRAGEVVTLRGGYALGADGLIDERMNQDTDMQWFVVMNGEPFTFLPCEYLGMRYVQVENSPMPITAENFSFIVRHAELDETRSSFESSDATLNAVWNLCKHSLYCGAQEQFLDTPTREKGGFLVDSMNESLAAMMAFGERALTRRTLHEFLDSMEQYWASDEDRGRMNAVYPNGDGARDIPDFTQAYLVWVWEYYLQTGDKDFLAENLSKLKENVDYVLRYRNANTGLIHQLRGGSGEYLYGIVDWVPSMRYGYDMQTDARTVVNCYAYADCAILAKIANELGKTGEAIRYRAQAQELNQVIHYQLLITTVHRSPTGIRYWQSVYADGLAQDGTPSQHASQQANMITLALGIVPETAHEGVLEHVKELKLSCGMVTVYWLLKALGKNGQGEHLLELLTNAEWDGWAKTLANGATCTWESWDADLGGNLSQSHPWGAVALCAIQQYVLGVRPLSPQYERAEIKPLDFGNSLTYARGRVPTERGEIFVEWTRQAASFELRIELPVNVTARVCVPRAQATPGQIFFDGAQVSETVEGNYLVIQEVGSGTHNIEVKYGTYRDGLEHGARDADKNRHGPAFF
jgi:alpha-L-rhamnosidase